MGGGNGIVAAIGGVRWVMFSGSKRREDPVAQFRNDGTGRETITQVVEKQKPLRQH